MPEIEILPWRRVNVLAVQVYPSPSRPHYLKAAGVDAGVYVRIGSTNRRADGQLIAEMRRASLGKSFDEQAMPELDSEAIDFNVASECFAAVRTLRHGDLETLRLLVPHQGGKVPSIGGVLLFGRDRKQHFPDAWVQAGRFAGVDKAMIVDSAVLHGSLPQLVESAIGFVGKHGLHGYDIGAVRRTDTWSLPPVALREAIVNAVVHAAYSQRGAPLRVSIFDDRVEVESPGLLAAPGLPPPLLEEIGLRFRVTLETTRGPALQLDRIDQTIVDALSDARGLSTHDVALLIGRTPRTARTRLAALVDRGIVREIGTSPQDPQRRYFKATRN